jgi:hypothetical protein
MVRAILDTLTAQGGTYVPHLARRSPGEGVRRITGARPARLLEDVGEGGTQTTFMHVAEARPQPVLTFSVSRNPRTRPTEVTLTVPAHATGSSEEVDRLLGVCKGLYLFLESAWGIAGLDPAIAANRPILHWANFFGPELVSSIGVARLLTSVAFMVEILPDGGVMLVTHPAPALADTPDGVTQRVELERGFVGDATRGLARLPAWLGEGAASNAGAPVGGAPVRGGSTRTTS